MQGELFERFVDAISRADAPAIAATLSREVRLRALVPPGLREADGPEAVAAKYVDWFGGYSTEVTAAAVEELGGRTHITYRLRLRKDGAAWDLEQNAFCDVQADSITRIDLVCSGFRPVVEDSGNGTYRYDAGEMSCNDGLDEQLKRAISSIPVGSVLEVRARDAVAKVELPSFVRLLGHEVRALEEPDDGGVLLSVERKR